jgi:hypothetical protein
MPVWILLVAMLVQAFFASRSHAQDRPRLMQRPGPIRNLIQKVRPGILIPKPSTAIPPPQVMPQRLIPLAPATRCADGSCPLQR